MYKRRATWYDGITNDAKDDTMKLIKAEVSPYPRQWRDGGRMVARKDSPAGKTRVFVSIENESLLDNFANRTSRPYTEWKPFVIEGLKQLGIENVKLRWSQKAGCSMCPCSPGFYVDGYFGQDIWVTIDAEGNAQRTDDDEAAHRAAALLSSI